MNNTPNQAPLTVFDPKNPPPPPGAPLILGSPKVEASPIIQADASGRIIKEAQPEQPQIVLQPFPDGSLFRFGPSGKPDGSCVLVDANNQAVALVRNAFLADFLCRAAHLFFTALKEQQTQVPKQNENAPAPADTNLPAPGSTLVTNWSHPNHA